MLQVPIFHVNGEDPEAVAQVVQLAMDFRADFSRTCSLTCMAIVVLAIMRRTSRRSRSRFSITKSPSGRMCVKATSNTCSNLKIFRAKKRIKSWPSATRNWNNNWRLRAPDKCETIPDRHNVWSDYIGDREPAGEPDTGVEIKTLSRIACQTSRVASWVPSASKIGADAGHAPRNGRRKNSARLVGRRSARACGP